MELENCLGLQLGKDRKFSLGNVCNSIYLKDLKKVHCVVRKCLISRGMNERII